MVLLSDDAKQRLSIVIEAAKTVFHYGFIPTLVFLGFNQGADPGMPELSIVNLLFV